MGHNKIVHAADSRRPESARKVAQVTIGVLLRRKWDLRQEVMIGIHVWSSSSRRVRSNLLYCLSPSWWSVLWFSGRSVIRMILLHVAAPWAEDLRHLNDRFDFLTVFKRQLDWDILEHALKKLFNVGDFCLQDPLLCILNLFEHSRSLFGLWAIIFKYGQRWGQRTQFLENLIAWAIGSIFEFILLLFYISIAAFGALAPLLRTVRALILLRRTCTAIEDIFKDLKVITNNIGFNW